MDKKKLIQILGALFVFVIFIGSYVSGGFGNSGNVSTTTIINLRTVAALTNVSASIVRYEEPMTIEINCTNTTLGSIANATVSNTLLKMEDNNTVYSYYSRGENFTIDINTNTTPMNIYGAFSKQLNASELKCTAFYSQAFVSLPQYINFSIGGQLVRVLVPQKLMNYIVKLHVTNSTTANVRVFGIIIASNATLFNATITPVTG